MRIFYAPKTFNTNLFQKSNVAILKEKTTTKNKPLTTKNKCLYILEEKGKKGEKRGTLEKNKYWVQFYSKYSLRRKIQP